MEYKFRGQRTDDKSWVYGYYIKRNLDGYAKHYIYRGYYDELEISEYCNSCDCMEPKNLKDLFIGVFFKTVGMYTGFKDKHGKMIFEGDVIKYTRTNWYCPGHKKHNTDLIQIHEIYWDDDKHAFCTSTKFKDGGGSSGLLGFNDERADENIIEIIGNIHESKHLLD